MTRPDLPTLLADLRDEGDLLEELLRELPDPDWDRPTPAEGWAVRHQAAHLAWTDRAVLSAVEDPVAFAGLRERFVREPDVVDHAAEEAAARPPAELLETWHDTRSRVLEALAAVPEGGRIPWLGPPLGAALMATARIMETWAHGQDVRDALGRSPAVSSRLRHIAHLAAPARSTRRPPTGTGRRTVPSMSSAGRTWWPSSTRGSRTCGSRSPHRGPTAPAAGARWSELSERVLESRTGSARTARAPALVLAPAGV